MNLSGKYNVDRNTLLQKAYYLSCVFFANKEISRRSHPEDNEDSLSSLEKLFFETEASRLLLELAIALRVLDDQMTKLPQKNPDRIKYFNRRVKVDASPFGLFDELNLTLRKTCDKIIHSDVMEPHTTDGHETHSYDYSALYEGEPSTIEWSHLDGRVRLSGKERRGDNEWYVLLEIEVFIRAIFYLLRD